MRFTLLFASSALAAGLALSACSSGGGSQAIPGGSQAVAPMGHHSPYQLVIVPGPGVAKNTPTCPSSFLACYLVSSPSTATFGWCLSTSGNCTSGLLPGKWKWKDTTKVTVISTGKTAKGIKSKWSPKVGNPSDNIITVKSGVGSTGSSPGYEFTFEACGKYNGVPTCPTATIGIIVS